MLPEIKMVVFAESWTQGILGWVQPGVNIFLRTKSLRAEGDAVSSTGSARYRVWRVPETQWNCQCATSPATNGKTTQLFSWRKPVYQERHDMVIFLPDNTPTHWSVLLQDYLKSIRLEVYCNFLFIETFSFCIPYVFIDFHALAENLFHFYENMKNDLMSYFTWKVKIFWLGVGELPKEWNMCTSWGQVLRINSVPAFYEFLFFG